jgi:hypothetical protein
MTINQILRFDAFFRKVKPMSSTAKNRRAFALGLAVIATAITLASAGASYSINLQSFADWPPHAARVFAVLATVGIEATFALLLYGVANALSGSVEKGLALVGLAALVAIMAVNFSVHRQSVTGAPLASWEVAWTQYAGSVVLFGILALVVALSLASHEARERRLARDIEFISRQKALEWRREALESPALSEYLEGSRPAVYESVRRQLHLPTTPAPADWPEASARPQ